MIFLSADRLVDDRLRDPGPLRRDRLEGVVQHLAHVGVAQVSIRGGAAVRLAADQVPDRVAQPVGLRRGDLAVLLGLVDHRADDVGCLLGDRGMDVVEHGAHVLVGDRRRAEVPPRGPGPKPGPGPPRFSDLA